MERATVRREFQNAAGSESIEIELESERKDLEDIASRALAMAMDFGDYDRSVIEDAVLKEMNVVKMPHGEAERADKRKAAYFAIASDLKLRDALVNAIVRTLPDQDSRLASKLAVNILNSMAETIARLTPSGSGIEAGVER
jgi:hypothetical protein